MNTPAAQAQRDPILFVPPGASATQPLEDAERCYEIASAIEDVLTAADPDNTDCAFAPERNVLQAWEANRPAALIDTDVARDWRLDLGQRLADLCYLASERCDCDSIEVAAALGVHAQEHIWRLEQAGQQRLNLEIDG